MISLLILRIIAEYIAEVELNDVVAMSVNKIFEILDIHLCVDIFTNYLSIMAGLATTSKVFSRASIKKTTTSFIQKLTENPNFRNPEAGGADEEIINKTFFDGIQTEHFSETLQRYNSKTVKSAYRAIKLEIPVYQHALDSGMVPFGQRVKKSPQATSKPKTSSGLSSTASAVPFQPTHACHNCEECGHTWFK